MKNDIYKYDRQEFQFFLEEIAPVRSALKRAPFNVSECDIESIIDKAGELAASLGEVYMQADRDGTILKDGVAVIPPAFKRLWKSYVSFWRESGEQAIPFEVQQIRLEMLFGANPAFVTYGGFNSSAASLLSKFGTQEQKKTFLAKIKTLHWDACLCLTEPAAGSDISLISSQAYKIDDTTYHLTGEKVFISASAHDLTENTIYIVLACGETDQAGSYQSSCFLVPKYWPEADGTLSPNNVSFVKIEQKMGLRGCANAHLAFGKEGPTKAVALGGRENVGLLQLKSVMREARLGTGLFALGMATSAYHHALDYAGQRLQGRPFLRPFDVNAPRLHIIEHADIQRMLLEMKGLLDGCRGVIGELSKCLTLRAIAMEEGDKPGEQRQEAMAAFYTPIVKAYVSDQAWRVAELSMQVHGGVGYLSDLPIEQYARDIRVLSIWEGTNYIQSQDLVRDKLKFGRDSRVLNWFIEDYDVFLQSGHEFPDFRNEYEACSDARDALVRVMKHVAQISMLPETAERIAQYCTRILHMFGASIVARTLLTAATVSLKKLNASDLTANNRVFYENKISVARFFIHNILPSLHQSCNVILNAESYVTFAYAKRDDRCRHLAREEVDA